MMKLKQRIGHSLATLVLLLLLLCQTALAADFSHLVILHTNDTHGFDQYGDGHNGMAVLREIKDYYAGQGFDVLLLDAGDAIQDNNLVNYSKGKTAIAFFNAVGYDAATLGNHEFDYGQAVLAQRLSEAQYPVVSANIIVAKTGKTLLPPDTIVTKGDVRIGVIGLTTPSTIISSAPRNTVGLKFLKDKQLYRCVQRCVDSLKKQGCDLIIALGHLGSEESYRGSRSEDVLQNVHGIDIFIDGHDHLVKNNYVNGVLQAETGCYTNNIGHIVYENGQWVEKLIPFGTFDKENAQVRELLDAAQAEVDAKLGQVVGESRVALEGRRAPGVRTQEENSGDFVADAYLWTAQQANVLNNKVDAAIVNGGGIRKPLPPGPIKRADLVAMQPYNNQLYVVTITGTKLLEILESATSTLPQALGAFPQVAGIKYTVDTQVPFAKGPQYPRSLFFAPAAPGSRVTIESVGGQPFDLKAHYTVALTDFLLSGGDAYCGLTGKGATLASSAVGCVDAEATENYLVHALGGVIGEQYAAPQGRITIK